MGMVATSLKDMVLALTAIWVVLLALMAMCLIVAWTTCPLGMGMVALALLLLAMVIQALTPILVAVLALMARTTINQFSIPPMATLMLLLTILALILLVDSHFWMLLVSHWIPARMSPLAVGPISH
jgi:hypothetical protein